MPIERLQSATLRIYERFIKLNYWVGINLVGISRGIKWPPPFGYQELIDLMQHSPMILVDLFVGGVVLGVPLAMKP